jgi:adenylate cyclase
MYGELVPLGGGDPIPLLKKKLVIGRRENCDIVLRFPNISSRHCELTLQSGYWYIQDLDSRNGVRVNGVRVQAGEKRVDPGDTIAIAKHKYELRYDPARLGAVGAPPPDDDAKQIFGKSLLERAGLTGRKIDEVPDEYRQADADDETDDDRKRGRRRG